MEFIEDSEGPTRRAYFPSSDALANQRHEKIVDSRIAPNQSLGRNSRIRKLASVSPRESMRDASNVTSLTGRERERSRELHGGDLRRDRRPSPIMDLYWHCSDSSAQLEPRERWALALRADRGDGAPLFVRPTKRGPFLYCGEVDFVSWEGNSPISVLWRLRDPVPESLWTTLSVPRK
jgi:hypothetical protein